jgi:hypothetical protein
MEVRMRTSLVLGALLVIVGGRADGLEPIAIKVSPQQSFAPSTLVVRVTIEPSAENRVLEVVADGPNFYRSSTVQLEGKEAPAFVHLQFRNVPGGNYAMAAMVRDGAGRPRASARGEVTVMDPGQGN